MRPVSLPPAGAPESESNRPRRPVEVVIRIRPKETSDPLSAGSSHPPPSGEPLFCFDSATPRQLTLHDPDGWCGAGEARAFAADMVAPPTTSNEELFRRVVKPKMAQVSRDKPDTLCFLAYGHTSSGKTHTIAGGCRKGAEDYEEPGLLTLCVEELLRRDGVVEVAMLEVYRENIYDLLAQGAPRTVRRRYQSATRRTHVMVEGLHSSVLTSPEEWKQIATFGMKSRRTTATERNPRSSRSHAIFTVKSPGVRLCFVDLAGSERQTTFSAKLNEESVSINTSLSRLSTVLQALSEQQREKTTGNAYVNFRDTTLTVLLQRYLTGSSQTTFLACVHPVERHMKETMSTLRYTERIRYIHTSNGALNDTGFDEMGLYDEEASDKRLMEEIAHLREKVQHHQADRELLNLHRQRISELERLLLEHENRTASQCSASPVRAADSPVEEPRQKLNTTRRVTRWLLGRLVQDLPPLNIGFDAYFDDFLPSSVQVVGYVTTLHSLPPSPGVVVDPHAHLQSSEGVGARQHTIAFLDVGDFAVGLSVLDGGIPPQVRLHSPGCQAVEQWERFEYTSAVRQDEARQVPSSKEYGFILLFFQLSDATAAEHDDVTSSRCCDAVVSNEPLIPLAVVWCVPVEAPLSVKERALQRLAQLVQQGHDVAARSLSPSKPPSTSVTYNGSTHDLTSTIGDAEAVRTYRGVTRNAEVEAVPAKVHRVSPSSSCRSSHSRSLSLPQVSSPHDAPHVPLDHCGGEVVPQSDNSHQVVPSPYALMNDPLEATPMIPDEKCHTVTDLAAVGTIPPAAREDPLSFSIENKAADAPVRIEQQCDAFCTREKGMLPALHCVAEEASSSSSSSACFTHSEHCSASDVAPEAVLLQPAASSYSYYESEAASTHEHLFGVVAAAERSRTPSLPRRCDAPHVTKQKRPQSPAHDGMAVGTTEEMPRQPASLFSANESSKDMQEPPSAAEEPPVTRRTSKTMKSSRRLTDEEEKALESAQCKMCLVM